MAVRKTIKPVHNFFNRLQFTCFESWLFWDQKVIKPLKRLLRSCERGTRFSYTIHGGVNFYEFQRKERCLKILNPSGFKVHPDNFRSIFLSSEIRIGQSYNCSLQPLDTHLTCYLAKNSPFTTYLVPFPEYIGVPFIYKVYCVIIPLGVLGGLQLISRNVGKDIAVGDCTSSGAGKKMYKVILYCMSTNNKEFQWKATTRMNFVKAEISEKTV